MSVENPLAITGEVKYKAKSTAEGENYNISAVKFLIEGESVEGIITFVRTHLEASVAFAVTRLVELGVEAPE